MRPRAWPAAIAAAAAVGLVALAWRFLTFTGFTNDHYGHLAQAQQLLLGDRPIRDFADPGWPLMYLLSAAAWRVAGDALVVEWTIAAGAFAIASAITLIVAVRLSGALAIGVVAALAEIVIYPRTYSYPKMIVYAIAAAAMLPLAARRSRGHLLGMAAVTAAAFLLRHDHGLFVGVAALVCVVLASRADGWRTAAGHVAVLTAAAAAILLPWILYVALNGGLVRYFSDALEFSQVEAQVTRLRAWPSFVRAEGVPLLGVGLPGASLAQVQWAPGTPDALRGDLERRYRLELARQGDEAWFYRVQDTSAANLRALADDPHVAGTAGLDRIAEPRWRRWAAAFSPRRMQSALFVSPNAEVWLFWMFWSLPIAAAVTAAQRLARGEERWPGELAVVVALAVLAALVNAGFLRNTLSERVADAVVPAALLGAWLLGLAWGGRWRRTAPQRFAQAASLVLVAVTGAAAVEVSDSRERLAYARVTEGPDSLRAHAAQVGALLGLSHRQAAPSRYAQALAAFYSYLDRCTTPADRLIVTGEFPDVIVAARRPFASDGVVFGGGYASSERQDLTLERLRARPALFAIHMSGYDLFRARFDRIDGYLDAAYALMAEIPVEGADTIRIHVHAGRRPVSTDPETGWPCFR